MPKNYENKIVDLLQGSEKPVSVEEVRRKCGIGHWNTALCRCLQLVIKKRIEGLETSRGWVFWLDKGGDSDEK